MVARMVNRYVERVAIRLPLWKQRWAKTELKSMIYNMLDEYCQGEFPTARDVRTVLADIGSPDTVAEQCRYMHRHKNRRRKKSIRKILRIVQMILSAAAFILTLTGILTLALGVSNNLMPMLVGLLLALGIVVVQSLIPQKNSGGNYIRKSTRTYRKEH